MSGFTLTTLLRQPDFTVHETEATPISRFYPMKIVAAKEDARAIVTNYEGSAVRARMIAMIANYDRFEIYNNKTDFGYLSSIRIISFFIKRTVTEYE